RRRLRRLGQPRARRLRGFRALRRAGAAAARPVPQGLYGAHAARESRRAGAADRSVAQYVSELALERAGELVVGGPRVGETVCGEIGEIGGGDRLWAALPPVPYQGIGGDHLVS